MKFAFWVELGCFEMKIFLADFTIVSKNCILMANLSENTVSYYAIVNRLIF